MTNPVDDFEDYDTFLLGGQRSPGVCTFPNAPERIEGWENQVPSGSGGGYTVHKNTPPIEFDIEIYVWVGENEFGSPVDGFAEYEEFRKLFKVPTKKVVSSSKSAKAQNAIANARSVANDPNASGEDKLAAEKAAQNASSSASDSAVSQALQFRHPLTDKLIPPVEQVVIGRWGMPKPDGLGGGTARIRMVEFRPVVRRPTTAPGSTYVENKDPRIVAREAILAKSQAELAAVMKPNG